MILGSVLLGSFAGMVAFVMALASGTSFLAALAIYSGVGMLFVMTCILWTVIAPLLQSGKLGLPHGAQRPSET